MAYYDNKRGLGNTNLTDVKKVERYLSSLEKVGDEVCFTEVDFSSGQLYDSVIEGLEKAGFTWKLGCVVHRWFVNKKTHCVLHGVFRRGSILLQRERDGADV